VDFETNSKLTVDAFLSTRNDLAEFGSIISSCRFLFRNLFSNSRVEFVRRQANTVAHALAREAACFASSAVYYDIPNCIESIMINTPSGLKCKKQNKKIVGLKCKKRYKKVIILNVTIPILTSTLFNLFHIPMFSVFQRFFIGEVQKSCF